MKNAEQSDVVKAYTYNPPKNVMFLVDHPSFNGGTVKAHIKGIHYINDTYTDGLRMETADGRPFIAKWDWLRAVPRLQGTPKKVKNFVHQKGTKKWMGYDPKRIKPGVKVLCRDKIHRVVDHISRENIVRFTDGNRVEISNGLGNYISKIPFYCDIITILDDVYYAGLNAEKEQEAKDKYSGYVPNVWHFWQGGEAPLPSDVEVQVWLRYFAKEDKENTGFVGGYLWCWNNSDYDIIAFKIITD